MRPSPSLLITIVGKTFFPGRKVPIVKKPDLAKIRDPAS